MSEKNELAERDFAIWELIKQVELECGYDSFGRLSKLVYPVIPEGMEVPE